MRVDPAVNKAKVATELARLDQQRAVLRQWGCYVVATEATHVDCMFVPRASMRLTFPIQQQTLIVPGALALATAEIPALSARAFGVRIELDDFDLVPPSVTFCDPWSWRPLTAEATVRGNHLEPNGKAWNVILDAHPITNRTFLCVRGTREYHSHPQHSGDDWMQYRGSIGVFYLLSVIWQACIANSRPNLILGGPQIQIRWEYEPKKAV